MNVYYKRVQIYDKYPFNDDMIEDYVSFSLNFKKFKEFLRCSPTLDNKERINLLKKHLKTKNITLKKNNYVRNSKND